MRTKKDAAGAASLEMIFFSVDLLLTGVVGAEQDICHTVDIGLIDNAVPIEIRLTHDHRIRRGAADDNFNHSIEVADLKRPGLVHIAQAETDNGVVRINTAVAVERIRCDNRPQARSVAADARM